MADPRFFKNTGPHRVDDIADVAKCDVDSVYHHIQLDDVAPLHTAQAGQLTFLDNVKYRQFLENTKAAACIMHPYMVEYAPKGLICLLSEKPYKAYALAAALFYPDHDGNKVEPAIHPSASVAQSATIGQGCIIGAHTVIGEGVVLGDGCHIASNVSISHAIIGSHVRIHNGARVGQEGFGFAIDPQGFVPVPQLGRVIIGDGVNIGANTCIDRGAGPDTIIGDGTYIDNLCQIAHNVKIGRGCILTSQVGISGSTEIADYCVFGGQAGVAGHLKIGQGAQVGAQSGVTKDIEAGEKVMGFPARPIREFWKDMAKLKKLLSN